MFEHEKEYETVKVKVPKAILDFLKILRVDVEEYLERALIEAFKADMETSTGPFMENIQKRFPELKRLFEGSQ
ncbi:MAG: hypothetical protein QXN95_02060 [Candidatus Bathyarchaeia archaeon]